MGLSIKSMQGLTSKGCIVEDEYGEEYNVLRVNPHFYERALEIKSDTSYDYEDSYSFRAGSYGGYNAWREELARLSGYKESSFEQHGVTRNSYAVGAWEKNSGPFWELINFSDCEGVIGESISAKLYKDFLEYSERAEELGEDFMDKYNKFKEAFKLASDRGCVVFR